MQWEYHYKRFPCVNCWLRSNGACSYIEAPLVDGDGLVGSHAGDPNDWVLQTYACDCRRQKHTIRDIRTVTRLPASFSNIEISVLEGFHCSNRVCASIIIDQ